MSASFPRAPDGEPHAWGLTGSRPEQVWERFSPAYEAQAERLVRALEARGWQVFLGGAGSEDGEYVAARRGDGQSLFLCHLEEPAEARAIAALDDAALARWLDEAGA
ncbi:hypothetical protein [Paracoccus contaminans]|uniref:Uncharacterized protein n=1 Tax=Paracoccus contaminans TaxID=1945662 RepID=A0A1W6CUH7_9RHOB|nr:hypothetical protein [Paracoccus contaminans]ARJ68506.1 hypothetical protein B0A89_01430 [Paracoccus contaminans]